MPSNSACVKVLLLATLAAAPLLSAAERDGFIVGAGAGYGWLDCSGCDSDGGLAVDAQIGFMADRRLALLADLHLVSADRAAGFSTDSFALTGNLQFWVAPRFWLRAGLGVGQLDERRDYKKLSSDERFALTAGVGFDLFERKSFGFDLQGRVLTVDHRQGWVTSTSLLVGFNWY